jgi:hypothetical protein
MFVKSRGQGSVESVAAEGDYPCARAQVPHPNTALGGRLQRLMQVRRVLLVIVLAMDLVAWNGTDDGFHGSTDHALVGEVAPEALPPCVCP